MLTFTTTDLDRAIWEGSREVETPKGPSGLRLHPATWHAIAAQQLMDPSIDWVGYTYQGIPMTLDRSLDPGEVEVVWAFRKAYVTEVSG